MSLLRTIVLISIIFFTGRAFGQAYCDTLFPELVKQFDTYSKKKFDKLKKREKSIESMTAFNIATYFRQKSDTSYKEWYKLFIDITKRGFNNGYGDKASSYKACILFTIGKGYYFIDDFVQANSWFGKAKKANCPNVCLEYYWEETRIKLGNSDK